MAQDIKIEVTQNVVEIDTTTNVVEVKPNVNTIDIHNADGLNGITPHIGDNGNWWIGTTDTGVHAQGERGEQGESGLTPHIGENGNWFVGDVDLGVHAQGERGEQGEKGEDGVDGRDGKSAYQQAVEGGYTGTEQEFNCSLSLLADVAEGKKQIADAINTKGGSSNENESFAELAEDIRTLASSGITSEGIVQTNQFSFVGGLFSNYSAVTEIHDNTITSFNSRLMYFNANGNLTIMFPNLQLLEMTKLEILQTAQLANYERLKTLIFPLLRVLRTSLSGLNLVNIVTGTLEVCLNPFYLEASDLRNVSIGQGTDTDLQFQNWVANNVIAEGQSGIYELNSNLRTNLLEKLADHSEDGQTRTLRLGWLAHVTQENIDYANSKGWTLTT
jgi:hypothetical protein